MTSLGLLLLTAVLHTMEGAWSSAWPVMLLGLLWAPGLGWARWLSRNQVVTGLQVGIDAAWIGMATAWVDVAIVREAGIRGADTAWWLLGLATAWAVTGLWMGRQAPSPKHTPGREVFGVFSVILAVVAVCMWRADDLARPLDGYWYLQGADEEGHETLRLNPGDGWASTQKEGWDEAGAWSGVPAATDTPTIIQLSAPDGAKGRVVVAVRGPLGSFVEARGERSTVAAKMVEKPDEGPVLRYLERGVVGMSLDLQLAPGQNQSLRVLGEQVYVLPSTEAVWALHAEGTLRYVHYYQLLNQAENQVWADEMLTTRRATLHQPPGWSPLLSVATVFMVPDLPAGGGLFVLVLVLVGATAVRLGSLVAPVAPTLAWLLPAGMVASHGLLMLEPASFNFPDSLYAAALLAVAAAIAGRRAGWIAGLGIAAGLLRWPGVVVSTLLLLSWWRATGERPWAHIRRLWGLVLVGGVAAVMGVMLGEFEDLWFILYFETFPEHWHGNYNPIELLNRAPGFYLLWLKYTGGGLALAALGCLGREGTARQGARFLLGGLLAYSLMLCTIDHHVTHYFLPLVAGTGAALIAASAALPTRAMRTVFPILCLLGLWIFLWNGQV